MFLDVFFGVAGIFNEMAGDPIGVVSNIIDDATKKRSRSDPISLPACQSSTEKKYLHDKIIENKKTSKEAIRFMS